MRPARAAFELTIFYLDIVGTIHAQPPSGRDIVCGINYMKTLDDDVRDFLQIYTGSLTFRPITGFVANELRLSSMQGYENNWFLYCATMLRNQCIMVFASQKNHCITRSCRSTGMTCRAPRCLFGT